MSCWQTHLLAIHCVAHVLELTLSFVCTTALTLKRYKFNWSNPTAHWSLNLEDKTQRSIMMQIVAINNYESEFSKNHSGRGDTSQQVCDYSALTRD
jgi:hypothetical protein